MMLALVALTNGLLTVPPAQWRALTLGSPSPGTYVEVEFNVRKGSRVQALLLTRPDAERLHRGRTPSPECSSGFEREARMRCRVQEADEYVLIVDNRIEARLPAEVHLRVDLQSPPSVIFREVPPERRRVVVALSLAFFGAVVVFSARQFLKHT